MTSPTDPNERYSPVEVLAKPWYKSRWFNLTLGLTVTFACLGYALHVMAEGRPLVIVFREIGEAFAKANYAWLPLMLVLIFLFYWIKAWRWRMLLAPLGTYRTSRLFGPTMIGFAFNNVLPAHLGEFVRVFVFSRQSGLPKSAVLTTLVVERVFDAMAILGLLAIGLAWTPAVDPRVQENAILFAQMLGIVLLAATAYLIWPKRIVAALEWCLSRTPGLSDGLTQKITSLIETIASGLTSLRNGPLLTGIVITSLIQWVINGLLLHLSLWSFGIQLSPLVSCVLLGVIAVFVTVPSSPGYFGVIQFCFLMVVMVIDPQQQKANVMAASIYYHMSSWIPVTFTGMLFFIRSGLQVAEIEESQAAAESA